MTSEQDVDWTVDEGRFALGDFDVERGGTIKAAELGWQSHGTLNAARDNVIVYPCSYTATHDDLAWLIGPDGVLDPSRWFIVVPDMFSNGLSSSAGRGPGLPVAGHDGRQRRAQHRLLTEQFEVTRSPAAYGFSMGAGQAYHWAALYPELVQRAVIVCGSARTSVHNRVFLSGLLRHPGGRARAPRRRPVLRRAGGGAAAFGHVYAGWGLSQDFYRARLYRDRARAPRTSTPSCRPTGWTRSRGEPGREPLRRRR